MLLNVQLNTKLPNTEIKKHVSTLNKETGTQLFDKGFNQNFNAARKTLQDFYQHSVVNFGT